MMKWLFSLVCVVAVPAAALTSDQVWAFLIERGADPYYLHSVGAFSVYQGEGGARLTQWSVPGVARPELGDFLPEAEASARVLEYRARRGAR